MANLPTPGPPKQSATLEGSSSLQPPTSGRAAAGEHDDIAGHPRAAVRIAVIHGSATLSDFLWYPFLPLLALELAQGDTASALYWVSASWIIMGLLRFVAGPFWGYVADRVGRKPMLVRSQVSAVMAPALTTWIDAPWQLCIVMGVVGLFSANQLAAVSLTSVVVPQRRLAGSLALVSGAQYIGMTAGPAVGAVFIATGGYAFGAAIAAWLCAAAALSTLFLVPADIVRRQGEKPPPLERLRPTPQLWLVLVVQMVLFAVTYLFAIVSPVVLKGLAPENASSLTGIAFACSGLGSAAGIFLLSGRASRPGRTVRALAACSAGGAASVFLIAAGASVVAYIVGFTLVSLLTAAMMPAVNALTARNVPVSRRGTVFGLVSSAQAAAFVIGPLAATVFAATSYGVGFAGVGVALLVLALLIARGMREPAG